MFGHAARGRDFVPALPKRELRRKLDRGYEKLLSTDQTKLPLAHEAVPEPTIYFGGTPASVLSISSELKLGEEALLEKIEATSWMLSFVSSLFGPFRMSKLITDEQGIRFLASDIRTTLKKVGIAHPIAQLFAGAGLSVSRTVGDGATYTIILAGKILERCWELLRKGLKPATLVDGILEAYGKCLKIAEELSVRSVSDVEGCLRNVLANSLMNRLPGHAREKATELMYKALDILGLDRFSSSDAENALDIKTVEGGSLLDSFMLDGVAIFKELPHPDMPKKLRDVKVAIIKGELRIPERLGRYLDLKLGLDGDVDMKDFLERKRSFLRSYAERLWKLDVGAVIVEKGVDPELVELFAGRKTTLIFGLPYTEVELISRAAGAIPAPEPGLLTEDCLGWAGTIEEVKINKKKLLLIYGCKNPKSVTVVLQGSDNLLLQDVERCIRHSIPFFLSLKHDGRLVYGGGAFEIETSLRLRDYAECIPDKRQLVIKSVADAFEDVVSILSTNIGKDPIDVISILRAKHVEGFLDACIAIDGNIGSAKEMGLYDSLAVKLQAIRTAFELAYSVLRIDGIIFGRKLSEPEYYYVKRIKGTSQEKIREFKKDYGVESLG